MRNLAKKLMKIISTVFGLASFAMALYGIYLFFMDLVHVFRKTGTRRHL